MVKILNINDTIKYKYVKLIGKRESVIIPEGVLELELEDNGLKSIVLPNSLIKFESYENNINNIELPENIEIVQLASNNVEKITVRKQLKKLHFLNIRDNKIKDIDFVIPSSIDYFYISGNENIKIKYLDFLFDDCNNIKPDTDFLESYKDGELLYNDKTRTMVAQRAYLGRKYIDIKSVVT